VFEDDENIRRFLSFALTAEGYAVDACGSYDELVQLCEQSSADLIIADAWGESTTTLDPAERQSIVDLARQCPLIMATGREWAARVDPAELGLVGLLLKPFELEDLLVVMRSLET
jgi:DNA-binding response OmpR family regulator